MSLAGNPAMTSSQQDVRSWQQSNGRWTAPRNDIYPDEQFSDREISAANPLDERLSEPESSIPGDMPFDPRSEHGLSWHPSQMPPNGFSQPGSIHDTKYRNPDLREVIDYLSHDNDAVKANAAAYLQHLTYLDDNIKAQTRVLRGIPALLDLASHPITEVHRAACGTLRNLSFGKANDESKREIKNSGGITILVRLLRTSTDNDVRELVTGILWNLSSCSDLKRFVIDESLKTVVDFVVKPAADWQQTNPDQSDINVAGYRSTVFRNASGVLRNVSSDGDYARRKLRECDGLIEAIVLIVRTVVRNSDMDNKSVENCICVLRNLSFACQEIIDPSYLQKRTLNSGTIKEDETTGCFGNKKKSLSKNTKASQQKGGHAHYPSEMINRLKEKSLWHPDIVKIYLPILRECNNPDTLEAAAGAIQNLAAGDWEPAADIRTAIRQEKGLPLVIDLLRLNSDRVVCAAATALRNLALDNCNKELIGKYAMAPLVSKLPSSSRQSELQLLSNDTITAVESALYEIIKTNSTHAKSLIIADGIERLMFIVRAPQNEFSDKAVRFASQLLVKLWQFNEFHEEYKRRGWRQVDFLGTSGTGLKSQPPSAENTINRSRQSQSGPGGLGTAHINRSMTATQPPPYGSTSSLVQPYNSSLQPRVNTKKKKVPTATLR